MVTSLLFRNGAENYFQPVDGNLATASLISDAVHIHNLEELTDGCLSFINFPRNSLIQDLTPFCHQRRRLLKFLSLSTWTMNWWKPVVE